VLAPSPRGPLRKKQNLAYKQALQALSSSGGYGTSYADFVKFLEVRKPHWPVLVKELITGQSAIQRAKHRMIIYRSKVSLFDWFGQRLFRQKDEDGNLLPVEVLLGLADFAPGGRGERSVPTRSLFRLLMRVALRHNLPVRWHKPQDEFHTTKHCYLCGGENDKVGRLVFCKKCGPTPAGYGSNDNDNDNEKDSESEPRTAVIEGNETSSGQEATKPQPNSKGASSPQSRKTEGKRRHRDVNGARNMLLILMCKLAGPRVGRPSWLVRPANWVSHRERKKMQLDAPAAPAAAAAAAAAAAPPPP
jgi:hypothetical protein